MLLVCPKCGKKISDRASVCPFSKAPRQSAPLASSLVSRAGRRPEGLSAFDFALAVDPRYSPGRFFKAHVEDQLGRPQQAARSYQQFLSVAPPYLTAQIRHARARLEVLRGA